jgi:hypothetical protein
MLIAQLVSLCMSVDSSSVDSGSSGRAAVFQRQASGKLATRVRDQQAVRVRPAGDRVCDQKATGVRHPQATSKRPAGDRGARPAGGKGAPSRLIMRRRTGGSCLQHLLVVQLLYVQQRVLGTNYGCNGDCPYVTGQEECR